MRPMGAKIPAAARNTWNLSPRQLQGSRPRGDPAMWSSKRQCPNTNTRAQDSTESIFLVTFRPGISIKLPLRRFSKPRLSSLGVTEVIGGERRPPHSPAGRSGVASPAAERREADHCRLSGVSPTLSLRLAPSLTPTHPTASPPLLPLIHSTPPSSLISLNYHYPLSLPHQGSFSLPLTTTQGAPFTTLHSPPSPASPAITAPSTQ